MEKRGKWHGSIVAAAVWFLPAAAAAAGQWTAPAIEQIPSGHPVVACTPAELARLQAAYQGEGEERKVVADVVTGAKRRLRQPVEFPPRGGQHNQWYQCEECQIALKTLDPDRHECPKCKTVYSGEPYDDVVFSRVHSRNLQDMVNAAWAYAVTGEADVASFAAEILLGYAIRYREYPYHSASRNPKTRAGGRLFEQTLNEASAMAGAIAPAYDLIHDADVLSADDHRILREGLLLPMLENIGKYRAGKSNWQTWHNAAMLWGGAVLGDVDWVRRAITDPGNGFVHQMEVSVSDEGMWYENSWGYHFYTLGAMVRIVEGAQRLGIDLWSHPDLKKMFLLPVEYAMPDGSLPRFGDDVNTRVGRGLRMLEYAYPAYNDPAMAPYLPTRPSWESIQFGREVSERPEPPPQASKVFPGTGHAVLRTHGEAGLAAALTFGPYGGFHGHFDKLSFVFFGYGQELGLDPGRARSQAYRLPVHSRWYKATISHNTVLVDRQSQAPAAGKLAAFAANGQYAAVVARCDEAYKGVEHRRLVCLTPTYLLVFDDLAAGTARHFDWLYHNRGSAVECEAAVADDSGPLSAPGWEYVENVRFGTTGGPVHARFADAKVATHLTMAPAAATAIRIGDGVGESIVDRVPMIAVSRHGTRVQFAAALEPVPHDGKASVASVVAERLGGAFRITVERDDTRDTVTLTDQDTFEVRTGDHTVLLPKPVSEAR